MTTTTRTCACGCGEPINNRRPAARYATNACRTRAWKARRHYTDQRRAQPSRNAKRTRPPDPRVSLNRLLPILEAKLGREEAWELVRECLPPRLRQPAPGGR